MFSMFSPEQQKQNKSIILLGQWTCMKLAVNLHQNFIVSCLPDLIYCDLHTRNCVHAMHNYHFDNKRNPIIASQDKLSSFSN